MVSLRRCLSAFVLVVLTMCLWSLASACGGTPQAASPPGSPPSFGDPRPVLLARPELTSALSSDALRTLPGVSGVDAQSFSPIDDVPIDPDAVRRADAVELFSNETAERMARQGLLRPLDTRRIPEWDRLYPLLKRLPGVVVDGKVYMVPLTAAVTGIISVRDQSGTMPTSFKELFADRYVGRLAFNDDAALAFQISALDLGLPHPDGLTSDEALKAEIHLKGARERFAVFWDDVDDLARAFKSGRVTVAVGDRSDALGLRQRGASVAYTLAIEGQPLVACGLAMTASSNDPAAVYALINDLLQPAAQVDLARTTGDLVANRGAARLVPSVLSKRLGLLDLARLSRPVPRIASLEHLDWVQSWYEVKMGRG
jgi:hypothetical protein